MRKGLCPCYGREVDAAQRVGYMYSTRTPDSESESRFMARFANSVHSKPRFRGFFADPGCFIVSNISDTYGRILFGSEPLFRALGANSRSQVCFHPSHVKGVTHPLRT